MNKKMIAFVSIGINLLLVLLLVYVRFFTVSPQASSVSAAIGRLGDNPPHRRIAILRTLQSRDFDQTTKAIVDTLRDEGQFIADVKIFDGNNNRMILHSCIDEIIKSGYDLICVLASQGAQMVREATARQEDPTPVVFVGTGDPVKLDLVDSLEHPGRNITGVCVTGFDWAHQAATFIPALLPHVRRVLIPYNPASYGGAIDIYRNLLVKGLEEQGIKATSIQVYETNETMQKVAPFVDNIDLLIVLPDATLLDAVSALGKLGEQHQFGVYALMNYAKINEGAALGFGFCTYDSGKKAAGLIRRILENGESPANIPVHGLNDVYRFAINKKAAQAQGIYEKMDPLVLYLMDRGQVI